jgi:hypothetical protein
MLKMSCSSTFLYRRVRKLAPKPTPLAHCSGRRFDTPTVTLLAALCRAWIPREPRHLGLSLGTKPERNEGSTERTNCSRCWFIDSAIHSCQKYAATACPTQAGITGDKTSGLSCTSCPISFMKQSTEKQFGPARTSRTCACHKYGAN